jgi:hypothetical protein
MKSDRIYHHYVDLEEYHAGMWRKTTGIERKTHIHNATELMRDVKRFEEAMKKAVDRWENSCNHNLTADNSNRIAWLGHAGCCVEVGSPEEATRAAWHKLLGKEQDEANAAARRVLMAWDSIHRRSRQIELFMEEDYV